MILAGGRGSRLHDLTKKVAKPAVSYGGKYRIIDFPLSNCANSGIDVVGVLTQYESVLLNSYAAAGRRWGLDTKDSGVYILPPREKADANLDVYRGTADAISQNIDFMPCLHKIVIGRSVFVAGASECSVKSLCVSVVSAHNFPFCGLSRRLSIQIWTVFIAVAEYAVGLIADLKKRGMIATAVLYKLAVCIVQLCFNSTHFVFSPYCSFAEKNPEKHSRRSVHK